MRRRLLTIAALAALLLAVAAAALAADGGDGDGQGDDGSYRVRATFRNAFAVVADVDVRVAGARVGSVESVDVDGRGRAVLVLRIDDPGFQAFRTDAECAILPQSIIGERYVDCRPTQARAPDSPAPPLLRTIDVDGQPQHPLPVERTSQPIDLDLVGNMWREPQRARLAVILNELGIGLAGRGEDLDDALRAALPGLRDSNRVLELIAGQTRALRQMVTDGERALEPVARSRERLVGFLRRSADLQEAILERRGDLDENLRRLPATLRQVTPAMDDLRRMSDRTVPTVARLRRTAPTATALLRSMREFSRTATAPMVRLGAVSARARRALVAADPVVAQLERLTTKAAPVLRTARALAESLRTSGGSKRLLDYSFYQGMAINGFDDVGHYLRALAVLTRCSSYAEAPVAGCATGTVEPGTPQTNPPGTVRTAAEALGPRATLSDRLTAQVLDGTPPARLLRGADRDPQLRALRERVRQARAAGGGGR
ncbi:MlaD family protein [Patulibacter defluvii]|uniref:MlaD family protein n=1 Tax=Patulibacter defluvii TaxID=3095358 RepID=UPI002A7642EC|nr:MlaD family protein [Patulibacter sp. DM4]